MGMTRIPRLTISLGALAAVTAGLLAGASSAAVSGPTGLHGFVLVASEPRTSTFHRTPSFAWNPTKGAVRYELQLSTSATFRDNGLLYDVSNLQTPVGAPTLTLPWISGSPHSLYARVRAFLAGGHTSPWSAQYGFDMVPPAAPAALSSAPGLVRWSIVDGADAYEVWLLDKKSAKIEVVRTNVLDERDFYGDSWPASVRWRVRAMRTDVLGVANGIPTATYGPWSTTYTGENTAPTAGGITLAGTLSDVLSNGSAKSPSHQLMPAFLWSGAQTLDGTPATLFRVYAFTDSQCLNPVFVGPAVSSPAYAPRLDGPALELPANAANIYVDRGAPTIDAGADGNLVVANEQLPAATPTVGPSASGKTVTATGVVGPTVDLWDVNWPGAGYYWTVVGVTKTVDGVFQDLELPQDVCAAGRVQRLGILSQPTLTSKHGAFATGLSANGRLVSAAQTAKFYGQPLVAWTAALGGTNYEVQWSHKSYPFAPKGTRYTFGTSAVLPLTPGTWFYRVRGFDYNLPTGAQAMAWSLPTKLVVTAPKFRIVAASRR